MMSHRFSETTQFPGAPAAPQTVTSVTVCAATEASYVSDDDEPVTGELRSC